MVVRACRLLPTDGRPAFLKIVWAWGCMTTAISFPTKAALPATESHRLRHDQSKHSELAGEPKGLALLMGGDVRGNPGDRRSRPERGIRLQTAAAVVQKTLRRHGVRRLSRSATGA